MRIKHKIKRLVALALSISMALLCMPMGVLAEETATPTDKPVRQMLGQLANLQNAHGDCVLIQPAIQKSSFAASLMYSIHGICAVTGNVSNQPLIPLCFIR